MVGLLLGSISCEPPTCQAPIALTYLFFELFEFPGGSDSRVCLQCGRPSFYPLVGKIPWRRKWLPTPVFLPGESHGQRSLVGYSPWGCKESDMTEAIQHAYWMYFLVCSCVDSFWIHFGNNAIFVYIYFSITSGGIISVYSITEETMSDGYFTVLAIKFPHFKDLHFHL